MSFMTDPKKNPSKLPHVAFRAINPSLWRIYSPRNVPNAVPSSNPGMFAIIKPIIPPAIAPMIPDQLAPYNLAPSALAIKSRIVPPRAIIPVMKTILLDTFSKPVKYAYISTPSHITGKLGMAGSMIPSNPIKNKIAATTNRKISTSIFCYL